MPVHTTHRRLLALVTFAGAALACTGCYDTKALVEQVRTNARRSLTHEIDLGKFHTTLPRDLNRASITVLDLELFGTVPQYRIPAIEKQLKADGFKLRHDTLVAIRQTTDDELSEPNLGQLRSRLMKVANGVLEGGPIQSIGVENIRIVEKR
jgi:hypothetical protein